MLRRKINFSKGKKLTVENLKQYKGLSKLSDKEAQDIVFALQAFAVILIETAIKTIHS